ncbi:MAG: DNA sulfur modification protein DndB [Polyangia bacterium]
MKVSFPAMRGRMGGRLYYSTVIALSEIPRFFKFTDWEQSTPELRAQRVLNKSRVPDIAKYILDNEDGYIFSSITASYRSAVTFVESSPGADIGLLEMELENVEFVINDGQHRCAAIAAALNENPQIGKDKISILLFETENLDRLQQMFSDLNRFAHKTSKSLDILYDHRDNLSGLTIEISEAVDVFREMVDRENITIPMRSRKMFTLSTLYDANDELLGDKIDKKGAGGYKQKLDTAVAYWAELAKHIPDWRLVSENKLNAAELRQEKINTHAVVMRALGGVGRVMMETYPDDWQTRLAPMGKIDWRKSVGGRVNPMWDNVCIAAGSVVSNRQARAGTLAVLRKVLGVEAVPTERSGRRGHGTSRSGAVKS